MPLEDKPLDETVRRLFFALWPDEGVRDRLQEISFQLRDQVAARWVRRENFHVTLAFLGAVPESAVSRLQRLDLVWPEAFVLRLESLRHVRRRQMIWIAPHAEPDPLQRLVEVLGTGLDACGRLRDSRPFHTHLTLARGVKAAFPGPLSVGPILWTVRSVALIESEPDRSGVRYQRLNTWPLQAMPKKTSME